MLSSSMGVLGRLMRWVVPTREPAWTPDDFEQSIPARFEHQVRRHGDRAALVATRGAVTYAELAAAAEQVRQAILSGPGAVGDRVLLLGKHDVPLIAGTLGVLRAGRVCVVLNPSDPVARLEQVAQHAEANVVVADTDCWPLARLVAGTSRTMVFASDSPDGCRGQSAPNELGESPVDPGSPAFLVYTSGSTGTPKGVIRSHRNLLHNAYRHTCGYRLAPGEHLLNLSTMSGGNGVSHVLAALLTGATCGLYPVLENGLLDLADWIDQRGVTALSCSPTTFRSFVRVLPETRTFRRVHTVCLNTEAATHDDLSAFLRHFPEPCRLLHTLSASEAGNISCGVVTRQRSVPGSLLPIGQPCDGIEVLLLDPLGQPVTPGEAGEIILRSRYLASGYWRDEARTAERFAFSPDGLITFRGGDRGRWNSDGQLEFMGREDGQLKIRGYRIESSEIEAVLRRQPALADVIVGSRSRNDDEELVAWLVLRDDATVSTGELRLTLQQTLPSHMIPAQFEFLEAMPTSPNGKVDRARFRAAPVSEISNSKSQISNLRSEIFPTNTESTLAQIWADALRQPAVRRENQFLDVGGNSLVAAVIAARVFAKFKVELRLTAFAQFPSLAELAAEIDRLRTLPETSSGPPIRPVSRRRPLPLSFIQERTWRHSQTPEMSAGYTVCENYSIRGPFDVDAFRRSLDYVVSRHEILRTTYARQWGRPVQVIHPPGPAACACLDYSHLPNADDKAREFLSGQAKTAFDLAKHPLLRFWLVRTAPEQHWFLRVNHHILSDRWSSQLFFRELSLTYQAFCQGLPPPLPPRPALQYGDYAAWQRNVVFPDRRAFERDVAWWRDRLAGASSLELPFKLPTPNAAARPADGRIDLPLDSSVIARLHELGRQNQATTFVVTLAAAGAVVADVAKKTDVVLGTYLANRDRVEQQELLGCFINLVMLRLRPDRRGSFRDWLQTVREEVGQTHNFASIPYEQLREELRRQGGVPPEIRLQFQEPPASEPVRFHATETSPVRCSGETMPWGFTLSTVLHGKRCVAQFDATQYDPAGAGDLLRRYVTFLQAAACEPDRSLEELLKSR